MIQKIILAICLSLAAIYAYAGKLEIQTDTNGNIINVYCRTESCEFTSWIPQYEKDYRKLVSSQANMAFYQSGTPMSEERIKSRIEVFNNRNQSKDPFNAYVVKVNNEVITVITLGHGYDKGQASMALVSDVNARKQGFSKEIIPVVDELITELNRRGCQVAGGKFDYVHASCRADLNEMCQTLERLHFKKHVVTDRQVIDSESKELKTIQEIHWVRWM